MANQQSYKLVTSLVFLHALCGLVKIMMPSKYTPILLAMLYTYVVHLMAILIWQFGEFVFIYLIKCTHSLHSSVSIRDLDNPFANLNIHQFTSHTNSHNLMSAKCTVYMVCIIKLYLCIDLEELQ